MQTLSVPNIDVKNSFSCCFQRNYGQEGLLSAVNCLHLSTSLAVS